MTAENILLGSINLGFAILITAICIPLVKRKIRMNPWYGVRIPKSFESDENWYKINAYGGKRFALWSSLLVPIGIAAFFIPFQESNAATTVCVLLIALSPIIVLIPAIIEIVSFSKKL